jgi:hypothetical protein
MAAIAFVVLGAAYLGVYELLTAEAKRERAHLERNYGSELTTANDPGPPPSAEKTEELKAFLRARDGWDARRQYEAHGRRIDMFFAALLGAFAVQSLLTAALALMTWWQARSQRKKQEARSQARA